MTHGAELHGEAETVCGTPVLPVLTRRNNYSAGNSSSINYGMNEGRNQSSGRSSSHGHSSSFNSGPTGSSGNSSQNSGGGSNSSSGSSWGTNRGKSNSENESRGYSETMENAIEPGDFARILKNGGKANGGIVTGVWFQSGRVFKSTGSNVMLGTFRQ